MRIMLDEHLPFGAIAILENAGYDVRTVRAAQLGGHKDDMVFAAAINEERLFITLDDGFADVRKYPPGFHHGVLVLHPPEPNVTAIAEMLDDLVSRIDLDSLDGCTAITQGKELQLRIRRPDSSRTSWHGAESKKSLPDYHNTP